MTINLCRLCKINQADQTNSHIFPRFMCEKILLTDNKRQGFKIDKNAAGKKHKPYQDTPKENHILCKECESKIGKFERQFANEFYNIFKLSKSQNLFPFTKHDDRTNFIKCESVDYNNFKLTVYSMLFRASISSLPFFGNTTLHNNQIELLRQVLNNEIAFVDLPLIIYTPTNDTKYTHNYIYSKTLDNTINYLWANEFIFYIAFNFETNFMKELNQFVNLNDNKIKVVAVDNEKWNSWRQDLMQQMVRQARNASR